MIKLIVFIFCISFINYEPITIRLVDSATGEGVSFAHVFFEIEDQMIVTNSDGYFNLPELSKAKTIRISHLNYGVQEVLIQENIFETKTIVLTQNFVELSEIEVQSSYERLTLENLLGPLQNVVLDTDKLYNIYLQEFVAANREFEKFSDGTGIISWDKKDNLIGSFNQCRAVSLPKETDSFIEMINPIPPSLLFEGLKPSYFINLAEKAVKSDNYEITTKDDFTLLNFTKSFKGDQYLTHYTLLFDGDGNIIQINFEMTNPSNSVRNLIVAKFTLKSIKGIYIFNPSPNPRLTFSRLESEILIDFKGKVQENTFVSQANVIAYKNNFSAKLNKKEFKKPLYKTCNGHTSEFWKDENMPIFSQNEYLQVMSILNP